jgi:hypothetical protein
MGDIHQALNGSVAGFLMPRATLSSRVEQDSGPTESRVRSTNRDRNGWMSGGVRHCRKGSAEGRCQVVARPLAGGRCKLS